jgi:preprotein translocase subunit SecG
MYVALISIIIFICVLLVLVVLSQNSKGGGLSNQFGGGSSNLIGVKRTGDLLEKLTWGFAIALVVLALSANLVLDSDSSALQPRSVNQERASQQGPAPAAAPATPQAIPNAGNAVPGTNNTAPATNNATPAATDTAAK